jgi:predicted choloylglycine hydrolase
MDEFPDYRSFDLRGSHALAGFELGRADPPFVMQRWWAAPPTQSFAASCADIVRDLHPHLFDEIYAYADMQQLDAGALWRMCCRVNLKAQIRAQESAEGCSTFCLHLADGRALVGRNYDYWPLQMRRQRIRFEPDCCALPSIGTRGGVPCGRYDGINAQGVFVSLHVVMTDTPAHDATPPGVPFHLVGRIALELCRTAGDARDLLLAMPHLSALNYLVADAQEAYVIETDPRGVRVLEQQGGLTAATNHFRHPDMRPFQGRRSTERSACRLTFMHGLAAEAAPGWTTAQLLDYGEACMADRSAPLCGATGAMTTLWSCVAELSTGEIRYAAGAPDKTPYVRMVNVASSTPPAMASALSEIE